MRAIRSITSLRVFAAAGTATVVLVVASRSCNCSTLTSWGSSHPSQEVIVNVVFSGQFDGQQVSQALKRVLTQIPLLSDSGVCGLGRQHPCRDLQPSAVGIQDGDRSIFTLRSTNELEARTVQRVEWIQHLHIRRVHAQGIVSAGAIIPMSIVSCRPVACLPTGLDGFRAGQSSFCPCGS
jgi:hypothetical protein